VAHSLSGVVCLQNEGEAREFNDSFKAVLVHDFLGLGHDQILLLVSCDKTFQKVRFCLTDLREDFAVYTKVIANSNSHGDESAASPNLLSISRSLATRQLEDEAYSRFLQQNVWPELAFHPFDWHVSDRGLPICSFMKRSCY